MSNPVAVLLWVVTEMGDVLKAAFAQLPVGDAELTARSCGKRKRADLLSQASHPVFQHWIQSTFTVVFDYSEDHTGCTRGWLVAWDCEWLRAWGWASYLAGCVVEEHWASFIIQIMSLLWFFFSKLKKKVILRSHLALTLCIKDLLIKITRGDPRCNFEIQVLKTIGASLRWLDSIFPKLLWLAVTLTSSLVGGSSIRWGNLTRSMLSCGIISWACVWNTHLHWHVLFKKFWHLCLSHVWKTNHLKKN